MGRSQRHLRETSGKASNGDAYLADANVAHDWLRGTGSPDLRPSATQTAAFILSVVIAGTVQENQQLQAVVSYGGTPQATLTYQWKAAGSNVGVDSRYYTPSSSDVGKVITVVATANNGVGSPAVLTSAATAAVVAATVVTNLGSLSLTSLAAIANSPFSATITGKTSGSTITATSSDGTTMSVSGTTLTGTFTSAGNPTVSLTEVLAGASNTPRTSTVGITVSAGVTLATPVLTWDTDSSVATPTFTVETTSPQVGDVITFQIDTVLNFASATGTDATIDGGSIASPYVQFTISALTGGATYYARAKITRGGVDSSWSTTVTVTVA